MSADILFVNLPTLPYANLIEHLTDDSKRPQSVVLPLGIGYLSSYMKKHADVGDVALLDYALYVHDLAKYGDIPKFIKDVSSNNVDITPEIIAISCNFSTSHKFLLIALPMIRGLWPEATIILGGHHATHMANKFSDNPNVDYIARGEGEIGFSEFISQFASGQPIQVPGIYARQDLGGPGPLQMCAIPENLDDLPFPDWDIMEMRTYTGEMGRGRHRRYGQINALSAIMTSRGCPFSCVFCSTHTMHGRTMRMRSVENVTAEILELNRRFNVNAIIPEDDLFTANPKHSIKLLNAIHDLNLTDFQLQFPNGLSCNTMNPELMDCLIRTGMKTVNLAIESGSQWVQHNIIKKNCKLDHARDVIRYFSERGVITRCFFVIGFPGETKELVEETIEFAKTAGHEWSIFSIATPVLGSELRAQLIARGDISADDESFDQHLIDRREFDTEELTADEVNDLAYRANLEANYINNKFLVQGDFEKAEEVFADIANAYPYHVIAWACLLRCHIGLGDKEKAQQDRVQIENLLANDHRAMDMQKRYGEFIEFAISGLDMSDNNPTNLSSSATA
jgi:anaerobic magnesium-protoporphyrin IX monomethyl ester cyclase